MLEWDDDKIEVCTHIVKSVARMCVTMEQWHMGSINVECLIFYTSCLLIALSGWWTALLFVIFQLVHWTYASPKSWVFETTTFMAVLTLSSLFYMEPSLM